MRPTNGTNLGDRASILEGETRSNDIFEGEGETLKPLKDTASTPDDKSASFAVEEERQGTQQERTLPSAEIRALFDRIAPVYDRLNQDLSWGQHRIWKKMAVKWVQPQVGDVGLDLCCGSGDLAVLLARRVGQTGRVIGVDFAAQQLAIARDR
ncbi:MAG: class I SAM-dependent methyltransferase, partial [Cyanobacteriota bacterium]|nr:class I SAM-dependent methyltransferase [Cyanobacteriota bacterium]